MNDNRRPRDLRTALRFAMSHTVITLLAIGTAFALPRLAGYIVFYWWPQIKADSHLLQTLEILLAAVLALLFNLAMTSWHNHRFVESAKLASLVHARGGDGWRDRWRERQFGGVEAISRDAFVMAVTGFHTFVEAKGLTGASLNSAFELRVLLMHPAHAESLGHVDNGTESAARLTFLRELEASVASLAALRRGGKQVHLKFYREAPFWKLVILGDHVWVQYCHKGSESKRAPEYVFALNSRNPRQGLFMPFYMHFLSAWAKRDHAEYDFDRNELIYRDEVGNEVRRDPFPRAAATGESNAA